MVTHFARWFPKSRAAETPNFSPKYATKSLKITIFAHMQNLEPLQTFSYGFSGAPRVFHNLHMI